MTERNIDDMYPPARLRYNQADGTSLWVEHTDVMEITDGVTCETYRFEDDNSKDLAVVTIQPGKATPRQRVQAGQETLEIFMRGKGKLTIWSEDGNTVVYDYEGDEQAAAVSVAIGQEMQWQADPAKSLVFFEICTPPYADGRFLDLPD